MSNTSSMRLVEIEHTVTCETVVCPVLLDLMLWNWTIANKQVSIPTTGAVFMVTVWRELAAVVAHDPIHSPEPPCICLGQHLSHETMRVITH